MTNFNGHVTRPFGIGYSLVMSESLLGHWSFELTATERLKETKSPAGFAPAGLEEILADHLPPGIVVKFTSVWELAVWKTGDNDQRIDLRSDDTVAEPCNSVPVLVAVSSLF